METSWCGSWHEGDNSGRDGAGTVTGSTKMGLMVGVMARLSQWGR